MHEADILIKLHYLLNWWCTSLSIWNRQQMTATFWCQVLAYTRRKGTLQFLFATSISRAPTLSNLPHWRACLTWEHQRNGDKQEASSITLRSIIWQNAWATDTRGTGTRNSHHITNSCLGVLDGNCLISVSENTAVSMLYW